MRRSTYLLLFMAVILISVLGGTFVFREPSWPGISLMVLAGHWLLKSKY